MLKRKLVLFAALAVMAGMFTSCINNFNTNGGNSDNDSVDSLGVDWNDYSNDYSLIIENDTSIRLIAFKGEPSSASLLGGVPAGGVHHIKNDKSIFKTTEDFVLFLVKESDFKEYKNDYETLKTMPFTTFYAFYNTDCKNENHFKVASCLGGEFTISLNNGTTYNIELRNKSVTGKIIGYCAANSYEQTFHVTDGEYMIFPVFKKYDKNAQTIISTYPTYKSGPLEGQAMSFEFTLDNETKSKLYNASDWVSGINFTPSAAYVKIINNADQGLQFFTSSDGEAEITETGGKRINTNKSLTYAINMEKLTNNTYEESKIVAGYRVGTNRIPNIYLNGDAYKTVEYKAGYLYTYTISGDPEHGYDVTPLTDNEGNLKAEQVDWSTF